MEASLGKLHECIHPNRSPVHPHRHGDSRTRSGCRGEGHPRPTAQARRQAGRCHPSGQGVHPRRAVQITYFKDQGYEIAGFGWFQGHKDRGAPKEEFEKHLLNLIHDLRKEFKSPKMPAVVATMGFNGYRIVEGPWNGIWGAQMAAGDPKQHPEFAGTQASVDTRDFWREREESPAGQDYHYNRDPDS